MKRQRIKILHSVSLLFITLLICCNVFGKVQFKGVKIINKTDIPLKLFGKYSNGFTDRTSYKMVKKGNVVSLKWLYAGRGRYEHRLKNIKLYIPGKLEHPVVDIDIEGSFSLLTPHPEVDVDGEKVKLMVSSDCFERKQTVCQLVISPSVKKA